MLRFCVLIVSVAFVAAAGAETNAGVALAPPSADALEAAELLDSPPWVEQPNEYDYWNLFPPERPTTSNISRGRGGRMNESVEFDCLVQADGRLACAVEARESLVTPALTLATKFRVASHTQDGEPTAGRRIREIIRLRR